MHKKGGRAGGLISTEATLSVEQQKLWADWIEKHLYGPGGDWATLVLDRAAKDQRFDMTGVDAQHLETRRFQIEEDCRALGIMPIMVGYSDKAQTYASAEQMFLAHVVHCLSPIYEDIEQSADINLLSDEDRAAGYYTKFIPAALLRGDSASRAAFYQAGIFSGWMTRNEARVLEDMDQIDGLDEPVVPSNMELIAALTQALADAKKPKPAATPQGE
jgi:HK97 family phage portal protein